MKLWLSRITLTLGLLLVFAVIAVVAAGNLKARARQGARAWAVLDAQDQPVSTLRFDEAEPFSNGYAAVALDGRWGYADTAGQLVIPARFREALPFDPDAHALVGLPDQLGLVLIDHTGAVRLNLPLRNVSPSEQGLRAIVVYGGTSAGLSCRATSHNQYQAGLIRDNGSWVVAPSADWLHASGPYQGKLVVQTAAGWHLASLDGALGPAQPYEAVKPYLRPLPDPEPGPVHVGPAPK